MNVNYKFNRKKKRTKINFQKNMIILFCLTILFSPFNSISLASMNNAHAEGSEDFVEITTAQELDEIRNHLNGHYKLGANIDISDEADWEPVGNENNPFTGEFNGNGFKITGMDVAFDGADHSGFFGAVSADANVEGLVVEFVQVMEDTDAEVEDDNDAESDGIEPEDDSDLVEEDKGEGEPAIVPFGGMQLLGNGDFAGGDGSIDNPYLIETPEQLNEIRNNRNKHFKLNKDINLDVAPYNQNEGWEPIGTESSRFNGTFVGTGFKISGLTIDRSLEDGVGLFGVLGNTATLKDVKLEEVNIKGKDFVGGLVGYNLNGKVSGSSVSGTVEGTQHVGGLVGYNTGELEVNSTEVSVTGNKNIGGLVGTAETNSEINGNSASGTVTGTENIGGLVGFARANVINSHATAEVIGQGNNIGGLVGYMTEGKSIADSYATGSVTGIDYVGGLIGSLNGPIRKSYATGEVKGTTSIGGLVGVAHSSSLITESFANGDVLGTGDAVGGLVGRQYAGGEIQNTYAKGNVSANNYVGGLVGREQSGTIKNSYATGKVTPTTWSGGLIGVAGENMTIDDSFYDSETSGQSDDTGKGTPKSTTDMQTQATFTNWDFAGIWDMPAGDYPRLQWEGIGGQPPVVVGGDVTAIYVDEDDNEIANAETHSGNVGEPYTTVQKTINGYTFKEVIGDVTGLFTTDPQEVTYVYEKDPEAILYDVIVEHVDKDGNELAPSEILKGELREPYTTEAKEIDGYTLIETPDNATGTFQDVNQTVTYVYELDEIIEEPEEPKDPEDTEIPVDTENPEETADKKDSKDPAKQPKEDSDDLKVTIQSNDKSGSDNDQALPKTATHYYTLLYIGLSLLIIGLVTYFNMRKRRIS